MFEFDSGLVRDMKEILTDLSALGKFENSKVRQKAEFWTFLAFICIKCQI